MLSFLSAAERRGISRFCLRKSYPQALLSPYIHAVTDKKTFQTDRFSADFRY